MISWYSITLFVTVGLSHYLPPLDPRSITSSPLKVELSPLHGSTIKAVITNEGRTTISLLKPGSILEAHPVEKVHVSKDGLPVSFLGMDPNFLGDKWQSEHFVSIAPGKTVENLIEVSETHDLSAGGIYELVARNSFPYAAANSNNIVGAIPYGSNTLAIKLTKGFAQPPTSNLPFGPLQKRSRYMPDCTLQQLSNLTQAAVVGAAWAASGAVEALKTNSSIWNKYFRFNDPTQPQIVQKFHNIVATRLSNVALELSSGIIGEFHCKSDILTTSTYNKGNIDLCAEYPDQAIAYTIRETCQIALCPLMWKEEVRNDDCMGRGFDQTEVLIHELTHCNVLGQVGLQPSTEDLAYFYEDTINDDYMTPGTSVQNAQTHALFAKASFVKGPKC